MSAGAGPARPRRKPQYSLFIRLDAASSGSILWASRSREGESERCHDPVVLNLFDRFCLSMAQRSLLWADSERLRVVSYAETGAVPHRPDLRSRLCYVLKGREYVSRQSHTYQIIFWPGIHMTGIVKWMGHSTDFHLTSSTLSKMFGVLIVSAETTFLRIAPLLVQNKSSL